MDDTSTRRRSRRALIVEGAVRIVLGFVLLGAILFLSAGSFDWPMAWALLGTMAVMLAINVSVLSRKNPEVIRERMHGGKAVKKWDKIVAGSMGPFALAMLLLGGFDRRYGWSPPFALWLQIVSLALVLAGDLVFVWAMSVNKFFAKMVRIQEERGHYVVTTGPYRYVRHPGYVGWYMMVGGLALALGSLWGLIPAAITMALMVVRTALEDRTLKDELPGYAEYARRVRYRLLPGVW
jgi:protein-S-isoprenylcysteine O-methyltransferase Ste14